MKFNGFMWIAEDWVDVALVLVVLGVLLFLYWLIS